MASDLVYDLFAMPATPIRGVAPRARANERNAMKRGIAAQVGIIVTVVALGALSTGCNRLLYGTNALSGITGWLLGSVVTATNTDRVCYENGVVIDCASLPADLGQ